MLKTVTITMKSEDKEYITNYTRSKQIPFSRFLVGSAKEKIVKETEVQSQ